MSATAPALPVEVEQPCSRCGKNALRVPVRFYRYLGPVVLPFGLLWTDEGEYCRECTRTGFLQSMLFTGVLGWWGVVSVFRAPVYLFRNVTEYRSAQAMHRTLEKVALSLADGEIAFSELPPIKQGTPYGAEWWIALSHLRSKKEEAFVSVVTMLSIIGVVLGVAVLNWVISVMTGFEVDLRDKILGANAHVVVLRHGSNVIDADQLVEDILQVDGIIAAAPFVYSEMMIRSPWATTGIVLKGLDPVRSSGVISVEDDLLYGPDGELQNDEERIELMRALAEPFPAPESEEDGKAHPGIFIGRELMTELQVSPGDVVQVINPIGTGTSIMGMPAPKVKIFRVAGVYYSGMFEYDTKWTYISNSAAQDFLQIGDTVTGIECQVDDIDDVEAISARIQDVAPYPHYTRHWMSLNQKLFEALALEKWVMGLILSMIVVVAALLIVTTLIMLVITKHREIAILKAMGASSRSVMRIFMIEGTIIGVVGTLLGTGLGVVGCIVLREYGYPLETDVYYLSELPVVIEPTNFAVISVGALVLCFLATIYPAYKASNLDPVEGLRYE